MKQRIQTAIIALIIFIPFLLYGSWPFIILAFLLATIGMIELLKMNKNITSTIPSILSIVFLWILLLPQLETTFTNWLTKPEIIVIFVMILLFYTVLSENKFTFDDAGFILISTIYVGMGFYFLIETRMAGLEYILYVLFVIWATDTGAYLFGRALGKNKLWPTISPNKTIEGAVGGLVTAMIIGAVFQLVHPFEVSMVYVVLISILISAVGQIGDLVASGFKRNYQVKDSGKLLPGHGGILDRLDSLLFVIPLLHFIHFI